MIRRKSDRRVDRARHCGLAEHHPRTGRRGIRSRNLDPVPTDQGDLIQGNSIGEYLVYPVDCSRASRCRRPNSVELVGLGNTHEGILLGSANATVGGFEAQDSNVICGTVLKACLIVPGASGNQVLGNQIGVVGPSTMGFISRRATAPTGSRSSRPDPRMIRRVSCIRRAT